MIRIADIEQLLAAWEDIRSVVYDDEAYSAWDEQVQEILARMARQTAIQHAEIQRPLPLSHAEYTQ